MQRRVNWPILKAKYTVLQEIKPMHFFGIKAALERGQFFL